MATQAQAKQWILASVGKRYDTDGYYGAQLYRPIFLFSKFSSLSRFFQRIISTQVNSLVVNFYSRLPLVSTFIPRDTLHASAVVYTKLTVSNVGGISTNSKVALPIVESIAADMIYDHSFRSVRNKSVHFYKIALLPFLKVELIASHEADAPSTASVGNKLKISVIKQCSNFAVFRTFYSKLFHIYQSIKCAPINQGGFYAYAN